MVPAAITTPKKPAKISRTGLFLTARYFFHDIGGLANRQICAMIGVDETIGVQRFLKRNISPFCLSHHSQYDSITAFFDFQNEKIFSFQVEDFRLNSVLSGAASRPKNTGVF